MADIKTRDAVKGTIKTIDKAAVASERMKSAYAKTKEKAEEGYYANEGSATEYAADKISYASDWVKDEGIHQFNSKGKKALRPPKTISLRQRTKWLILSRSGLPKLLNRGQQGMCLDRTACRSIVELQAVLLFRMLLSRP